jgi:hypothetical protein
VILTFDFDYCCDVKEIVPHHKLKYYILGFRICQAFMVVGFYLVFRFCVFGILIVALFEKAMVTRSRA